MCNPVRQTHANCGHVVESLRNHLGIEKCATARATGFECWRIGRPRECEIVLRPWPDLWTGVAKLCPRCEKKAEIKSEADVEKQVKMEVKAEKDVKAEGEVKVKMEFKSEM
ncbi:hypothetical protein LIA77_05093 [Sarocladium implicatum]|nr:hypothetical protein LIA77_05093 [Sarocladium implicatum]